MKETKPEVHEGEIVSVSETQITSTDVEGDEWQHTLAKDANVSCDGETSKLSDLKAGMPVRITICTEDDSIASRVSAGKEQSISNT